MFLQMFTTEAPDFIFSGPRFYCVYKFLCFRKCLQLRHLISFSVDHVFTVFISFVFSKVFTTEGPTGGGGIGGASLSLSPRPGIILVVKNNHSSYR